MEYRRKADQTAGGKVLVRLKRVATELLLVLVCLLLVLLLPPEAQLGIMSLFITKTAFVVIGILVAHATRKIGFPYIDLQNLLTEHHWSGVIFLAMWYSVIIWAFASGG